MKQSTADAIRTNANAKQVTTIQQAQADMTHLGTLGFSCSHLYCQAYGPIPNVAHSPNIELADLVIDETEDGTKIPPVQIQTALPMVYEIKKADPHAPEKHTGNAASINAEFSQDGVQGYIHLYADVNPGQTATTALSMLVGSPAVSQFVRGLFSAIKKK